jgi:hypothetical protein
LNKFALAIIAIVAVMAILIALPNITQQQQPAAGSLEIEYGRQQMTKTEDDFVATRAELLRISSDRAATYSETDPRLETMPVEKRFTVSTDDYNKVRDLMLDTGFMDIPRTDYLQVAGGADEYQRHTLTVRTGDSQKTFNWVEPNEGTVPPIVTNAGARIAALVGKN